MYKYICTAFSFVLTIFLLGSASAGSNGDAPQEGQDWIITQDTHVWDSEVNVKDIIVTFGKTLKLENVSLSSVGLIDINGDTRWINSTIFHEQSSSGENVSLQSQLTIINSEFTLRTIQDNEKETANSLYLSPGSSLIVRDYDQDSSTTHDQSVIRADVSGKGNYTEKFNYTVKVGGTTNAKLFIDNSYFEYINLVEVTGESSYVRNSTFKFFGQISTDVENFIFENNTMLNSYKWWDLSIGGNNSFIYNNTFRNGTGGIAINGRDNYIVSNNFLDFRFNMSSPNTYSKRGESTLFLSNFSSNNTITNNLFQNLENLHAILSISSDDNLIAENDFTNSGLGWHTIRDRSGYRNNYNNNTFDRCSGEDSTNIPWYQTCISFSFWSYPDDYRGGEHLIENNTFYSFNSGVRFLSYQDNSTIQNNNFDNGHHAIGLWNWPDGGNVAPSGITIFNNSINSTVYPIALDFHYAGYPGADNSVISNVITNTGHRAIVVWSTYKNFTIKD